MLMTNHSAKPLEVVYGIAMVLTILFGITFASFLFTSVVCMLLLFIPAIHSFVIQTLNGAGISNPVIWEILLFWLYVVILLGMRFLMIFGLFKLSGNLRSKAIFSQENWADFKLILVSYSIYAIVQYIGSVMNQIFHFTNGGAANSPTIPILIWLILYTVYLIFKYNQEPTEPLA